MRYLLIPLFCVGLICAASSAQADAIGLLSFGDVINHLEDQDWELIIKDGGTLGVLDVGDQVLGMVEIQRVRDVVPVQTPFRLPSDATFTGVFLVEVLTKTTPGAFTTFDFTFGPTSGGIADWTALQATIPNLPTPTHAGTMAVFYDDSSNPFVSPDPAGLGIPDLNAAIGTATDGSKLWELGFLGKPGEVWASSSSFDTGAPPVGPPAPIFTFGGRLNVTVQHGPIKLLPHQFLAAVPTGVFADVHFTGGLESPGVGDLVNFSLVSDTDFYIKPIPEPGSLALLGLGLLTCGGLVYRRRKTRA